MLDTAQLQLTSWGNSVGINVEDPSNADFSKLVPKEHQAQAKDVLAAMQTEMSKARVRAKQMSKLNEEVRTGSATEHDMSEVVQKIWKLSISRLKKLDKVCKKMEWAIYDKEIVTELLDVINQLMEGLEKLIPGDAKVREGLERNEVEKVGEANLEEVRKLCDEWPEERKRTNEAKSEGQGPKSGGDTNQFLFNNTNNTGLCWAESKP